MSTVRRILPRRFFAATKCLSTLINFNRNYAVYKSLRLERSVDANGQAIPWFTYPAIEYLASFDFSGRVLFEYGVGQSTVFWSKRCMRVDAVEHDSVWFEIAKQRISTNVTLTLAPEKASYISSIEKGAIKYDVIVIDGLWRQECADRALAHISEEGMIVLDNSDWYPSITSKLRGLGLFEIDFSGFGALNRFVTTTSIFIKSSSSLQNGFRNPSPYGGRLGGERIEDEKS
jgi:hypothetical protein